MSYFKVSLDVGYSFVVEGFPPVGFVQGDHLKIDDRKKIIPMDKKKLSISLADVEEYQGGFVKFFLMPDSPVSGLMGEMMDKQKKDMKIKKNHSFSIIIMSDGVEEFHLKKCLFNLQLSDTYKNYFFIIFAEDMRLKLPNYW